MTRVAIVTHGFGAKNAGGAKTMAVFLRRVLAESGRYEPHVVSLATWSKDTASVLLASPPSWLRGVRVEQGVSNNIPFQHVGVFGAELEFQRYRPRRCLTTLLSQFDLVQFVVGTSSWAATMPGALLWTATTIWPDRASRVLATSGLRRLFLTSMSRVAEFYERRALHNSRHVFALSEYTRRSLAPWTPKERLEVAPCGIDTAFFHPAESRPPGQPQYILAVARFLDPRKNLRLLVESYDKFWTPAAPELWLAGVVDAQSVEWIATLRSAASIRLLGARNAQELSELYRNALFFVLSSDEEGLGIVVLEAMASGLPIITTRCGGPESIVEQGETGLFVPLNGREELASAMDTLTTSTALRTRMARQARVRAIERFSIAAAGSVFLSRYDAITGTPVARNVPAPSRV
jgi:D-inositol-3-phosphate glycosyltransferase